ncbi:2751_t:CDS:2 [Funneliformis caledonium]|uniref:2751_t:CDS:1 n=1 Tax=Funneliformis caledonium TaxID=1117310 RepID=A0A9N9H3T8_9GLOM|nr:2751_t:CDS:2 [Funneliformis caledonium]
MGIFSKSCSSQSGSGSLGSVHIVPSFLTQTDSGSLGSSGHVVSSSSTQSDSVGGHVVSSSSTQVVQVQALLVILVIRVQALSVVQVPALLEILDLVVFEECLLNSSVQELDVHN